MTFVQINAPTLTRLKIGNCRYKCTWVYFFSWNMLHKIQIDVISVTIFFPLSVVKRIKSHGFYYVFFSFISFKNKLLNVKLLFYSNEKHFHFNITDPFFLFNCNLPFYKFCFTKHFRVRRKLITTVKLQNSMR